MARSNAAVAEPAEEHVLADAQHGEIGEAVAVDVERIGAGDRGQIGDRRRHGLEPQRPADRAVVAVQRGRRAAAGEVQLAATVVVAVERGDAATDEVLEVAVVAVVDAAGLGDEVGRVRSLTRVSARRRRQHQQRPRSGQAPPTRMTADSTSQRTGQLCSPTERGPPEVRTNRGRNLTCLLVDLLRSSLSAALVLAACGDDDDDDAASTEPGGSAPAATGGSAPAGGGDCMVGVSWNNYQEERWAKWDEPAIKAAIEAGGGTYVSNDAKSSAETQATNIENLISQGANVLIVLAQDGTAVKPSVASATSNGVPVDRLRPADRGPDGAVHHVRQRRGRADAGGSDLRPRARRATT